MKFKLTPGPDTTVVTLDGDIDEDISEVLTSVDGAVGTPKVLFDCTKVRKINSIGVKGWILVMERLASRFQVSFTNCPQAFVDMAVMVPAFTRRLPIHSFYALYVCDDCSRERQQLVEIKNGKGQLPPDTTCDKCGGKQAADDDLAADLEFVLESA